MLRNKADVDRCSSVSSLGYLCLWKHSFGIAHFTVTIGNEAGVDLVLIQPSLLYYVNHVFVILNSIFLAKFTLEKEGGLYQNNVTLSLTFTQRQGHQAHNCKMAYSALYMTHDSSLDLPLCSASSWSFVYLRWILRHKIVGKVKFWGSGL